MSKQLDEKYCGECAAVIKAKAEVCPACGVRQRSNNVRAHKGVATLLCFFLGWFGAHRFYIGRIGSGLLYLLFSWTFVPAFVAFIEFLMWTMMSEQDFREKYGNG